MAAGMLPPWGTAVDVYFSKFLIRVFIFRKSKKNIKKIPQLSPVATSAQ
jgi:hypothetical protein